MQFRFLTASINMQFRFSIIILANVTQNVMSFTTGANLSVKSTPGTWLQPRATNLALFVPSLWILKTHFTPNQHSVFRHICFLYGSPDFFVFHTIKLYFFASLHFLH